jgi:ATP/maltotriose-dependent transcriptional regulator MalT
VLILDPAAETFTVHLAVDAPLSALLLSRKRPRWASSRRILYGEIFELDRGMLAMSDDEAANVLGGSDAKAATGVIALAQGWAAVLALAAVSGSRPRELMEVPQLYSFFADEIFTRLDRRARRALCELALYDAGGRQIAISQLNSEEAHRVTALGLASGFLTEGITGEIDLHPLVRTFLRKKLQEDRPEEFAATVRTAVTTLLDHALWDEAYDLIQQLDRDDLLSTLVERAMDELLATGRTATLRSWLQNSQAPDAVLLLANAELAFREGRFYESEALAIHAANELESPDLAARAAFVGGRAAHVASRESQARLYFERAQATADDPRLSRRAALGALIAAIELEDPQATDLLASLVAMQPSEPSDEVVLADRQLHYETRYCRPVDLHRGRTASQLLRFVRDPVARTSFRNVFGYALAATAHWTEAATLTDEQLRDAERCRLDFVVPYALSLQAMSTTGLREYQTCSSLLKSAEEHARRTGDLGAVQMVTAVRMRALIAQGLFDEAIAYADIDTSSITRSLHGELLSVKALALAASGHLQQARALAEDGLNQSIGIETVINAHCALAVAALNQREHELALKHVAIALDRACLTGMIESLVCAYRGCPQLIVSLLKRRELHDPLALVLGRAGDGQLLASAGRQVGENSVLSLSPREKEVLALLAEGRSNAAIGQALFISPVTVKVHVRHIFDKLGVRSRAEAALRAAQLGRD